MERLTFSHVLWHLLGLCDSSGAPILLVRLLSLLLYLLLQGVHCLWSSRDSSSADLSSFRPALALPVDRRRRCSLAATGACALFASITAVSLALLGLACSRDIGTGHDEAREGEEMEQELRK